jgi:hypothetical protein
MNAICIKCWNPDAMVTMDMDGTCLFHCGECNEDFTPDEVRESLKEMQSKWGKLLKWVDAYPKDE